MDGPPRAPGLRRHNHIFPVIHRAAIIFFPRVHRSMISFEQALNIIRHRIQDSNIAPAIESVPLTSAGGRVLAEDLAADRDYPPFHRSTRDGFAVKSADVSKTPAALRVIGLARAGEPYSGSVAGSFAVEIMTGAPLPDGTDAVVMAEYTRELDPAAQTADASVNRRVEVLRAVAPWENVVRRGSEAAAGGIVIARGRRLGPGEIGLAASVGRPELEVFRRPKVAILPTGDEVIAVDRQPAWFQIRNSNALALSAQVEAAGGVPRLCAIAPDEKAALRGLIEEGLNCDLLLLSGGISVGRYDFVAEVLAELGAEIYFQGVAIRPGKPLAFGRVRDKFFFGLPGNPVSTFVTFELFARAALELICGVPYQPPVFLKARLGKPVRQKTGLMVFMPAHVAPRCESSTAAADPEWLTDPVVELVGWQGSGDLAGLANANCFLVIPPRQTDLAAGDWVDVLPKSWRW
jgi:molybdopterin molybdotransferase